MRSAVAAGLAAALAILVRPNLLPVALVIAVWLFVKNRGRAFLFLTSIAPGCMVLAVLYDSLFGSPFSSGYGDVDSLFSFENIPKTLATYPRWLIETHTPIVFAGLFVFRIAPLLGWTLLAVFAPSRWADVRAAIDSRSAASMSAACRTASALAAGA